MRYHFQIPDIMTASAASMVLCGSEEEHRYRGRIEKVKFGVPIHEAFAHDIPATLLVLLLKLNKEGPLKKDIWRAPGHEAQVFYSSIQNVKCSKFKQLSILIFS